jgi:NAD(P)H-hydrate epimerase
VADLARQKELEALLHEAGEAHHQAYAATDGADADWPIWYAEYLRDRLAGLLNASFSKSELVYLLISLDREVQRVAPGCNWRAYYARLLLERYG